MCQVSTSCLSFFCSYPTKVFFVYKKNVFLSHRFYLYLHNKSYIKKKNINKGKNVLHYLPTMNITYIKRGFLIYIL
jgi:hypothetical protein